VTGPRGTNLGIEEFGERKIMMLMLCNEPHQENRLTGHRHNQKGFHTKPKPILSKEREISVMPTQ